jgi:hypothetical protein
MHKTRVILTVDTEPSIAGAMEDLSRYSPLLDEPVWGAVDGQSEALGFITRILNEYNFQATFFVETVHTYYFGPQAMQRYTDHLCSMGQDIQLHIHPVWQNFRPPIAPEQRYFDACSDLEKPELVSLIREGCDQIQSWTGVRPIAMRTGNFSASTMVYQAMSEAGMQLASNLCIACADYPEASLHHSGGIHGIEGIQELPAACFTDPGPVGRGNYRSAQITACSATELIDLLDQCSAQSVDTVVLVTHPFEFIKKADFRYNSLRPNRLVQRRLERLCQFLAQNSERFQVSTFGALSDQIPLAGEAAPKLQSSVAKSLIRSAQNLINDRT